MEKSLKRKCKLCQEVHQLEDSHIIPKFIGRWLKKTSGTGYLRTIEPGGKSERAQDITKIPLLCRNCEKRINEFETFFANTVFYPLKKNRLHSIPTDERIGKFAVSVSLRAIWVLLDNEDITAHKWKDKLFELEKEWRDYLLDRPHFVKGPNSHNIIFHNKDLMAVGLHNHPNIILHLMRSSAFYIYEKFEKAYVSSHMAGVQIISMIEPHELPVSRGTQVYPVQEFGKIQPCGIGWGGYFQNLIDFAHECNEAYSRLTPRQNKIIKKSIGKDLERYRSSEDYKLMVEQKLILRFGRPKKIV